MKSSRIILINIIVLIVIVAIGFGGYYYFYQTTNFVTTDDATVDGALVPISALVPGRLSTWNGSEGTSFAAGQQIGQEDQGGENVVPGEQLATIVDLKKLDITANIDETDIQNINVGKDVDITIDALPNQTFTGKVVQIGLATNSTFSLLPQTNTSGNYTKVVQRIPVKISIDGVPSGIVPGMNATVKIHR